MKSTTTSTKTTESNDNLMMALGNINRAIEARNKKEITEQEFRQRLEDAEKVLAG